ncbi:Maf family protein [Marinomonas pollencensis]|uniref:dTTP/UTP pyrophosphatase n=1 Tax=Marinomonas pollencensis TaxID=491954 RepID=A0A3E0DJX2_9GAMM|nr:Maf family protein [Marinomonas pollencensis]REG81759.1 septum formation protein [Marinomonas pollencensis]
MLVLASASPRRKELLGQLVRHFEVCPADIDETPYQDESASDYVLRMAHEKALAATNKLQQGQLADTPFVVLASDTSVVVEGKILGKPNDFEESKAMLRMLSDRDHQVMTSVCLYDPMREHLQLTNVVSDVSFRAISDVEIAQYWRSGEPQDKAGSYAIQGLGAVFVRSVSGSYSAVVGLPLYETSQLLALFGIHSLEEMSHE